MTSVRDYSRSFSDLLTRWAFVLFGLATAAKALYFNSLGADPQPGDEISLIAVNLAAFTVVALVLPRYRNWLCAQLDILGTIVIQIDLLYLRMFGNLPSVNFLSSVDKVEYISKGLTTLFNSTDLLLYADLPLIASCLLIRYSPPIQWQRVLLVLLLGLSLLATKVGVITPVASICSTNYKLGSLVPQLGMLHYHAQDLCGALKWYIQPRPTLSHEDDSRLNAYVGSITPHHNAYTGRFAGSNLLLIQVESLQGFVIGRKVNGQPITPNLNRLLKESLWFRNFYHQTGVGRTSDAEFLTQTSLFARRFRLSYDVLRWKHFYALPQMLHEHGYDPFSIHGNGGAFYNRRQMHLNFGFARTYFMENLRRDDLLSWGFDLGISDKSLLQQAVPIIESARRPFYTFIVTLSSHIPYEAKYVSKQPLQLGTWEGTLLGRYLQAIHYTDEALGEFLDALKKQGRFRDTIIALYGDHNAIPRNYREALADFLKDPMILGTVGWAKSQRVGCIIRLPSGERRIMDNPGGEIDMGPTLINLLGLGGVAFPGLGHDLLGTTRYPVVFRDGSWLDQQYYSENGLAYDVNSGNQLPQVDVSNTTDKAQEMLYVAYVITEYDLVTTVLKDLHARALAHHGGFATSHR